MWVTTLVRTAPVAGEPSWNFVAAAEAMPFNRKPSVNQSVSQPLCPDVRQDLVPHPMALKNRQPLRFGMRGLQTCCANKLPESCTSPA